MSSKIGSILFAISTTIFKQKNLKTISKHFSIRSLIKNFETFTEHMSNWKLTNAFCQSISKQVHFSNQEKTSQGQKTEG